LGCDSDGDSDSDSDSDSVSDSDSDSGSDHLCATQLSASQPGSCVAFVFEVRGGAECKMECSPT